MNIIQKLEAAQITKLSEKKNIPDFRTGDTLKVNVKVTEEKYDEKAKKTIVRERIQAYEGVCIAKKNAGLNSSFTVRKLSYGEGVERVFPLYSPKVESIEVVRKGDVKRSKLYYLRNLRGKAARISERVDNVKAEEQA